jgi:hypothetical protein
MRCTVDDIETLTGRKTAIAPNGSPVPIKGTLGHLAGEKLNKRQAVGNDMAGGRRPLVYINECIRLIEYELLDPENEREQQALRKLHEALSEYLLVKV